MSRELHGRQILLVGEAGQHAIEAALAPLGGEGFVHEVAALYATRAGFERVVEGALVVDDEVPAELCANEACRAMVAASRAVLREVRRVSTPLDERKP